MNEHYVIIGGGIAGTVAAEKLRRGDSGATITILEKEPYRVYNKVLLPNIIQDTISSDSIFVRDSNWYIENSISIFYNTAVTKLDQKNKMVITSSKVLTYTKLILAIGGTAKQPTDTENKVYTFRTYDDTIELKQLFQKHLNCTIVGSSFISLELLLAAHHYQRTSQLLLRSASLWDGIVHKTGSDALIRTAVQHQTKIYSNSEIATTKKSDSKYIICLKNGDSILTDFITSGLGINAKPVWLQNTGLLGDRGVRVNEFLQTNDPNIYACGDCAEFSTPTGYCFVGNWQNAVASGSRVAKNILGESKPYRRLTHYQMEFHDWTISFLGDTTPSHASRIEDTEVQGNYLRLFYQDTTLIGLSSIGQQPPPPALISQINSEGAITSI